MVDRDNKTVIEWPVSSVGWGEGEGQMGSEECGQ